MRIQPLGDSAALLTDLTEPAYQLVPVLEKLPGVIEAVASYDTVAVYFPPGSEAMVDLNGWLLNHTELHHACPLPSANESKLHEIPVCYELGEDLDEAAARLSLTPEALIESHVSAEYDCFAVGFVPGFPYLGYLPPAISELPRRSVPRITVPEGSVAITGRQTGIYPAAVPGGWNLIGRTPTTIVDVGESYFPISAGDKIRFRRIDKIEFINLEGTRL